MPIDYDDLKKRAWRENMIAFNLTDASVRLKINNWASLRGIDIEDLLIDIQGSKYFKYTFAKDPVRQNIYEKAALEFLSNILLIKNVTKLPAGREKALFVNNGILTLGENIPRTRREEHKSKSIDIKFTVKAYKQRKADLICYAMHKYTEAEGGAQDNQLSDLRIFLENCPTKRQECYIAFTDGNYYNNRIQKLKSEFDILSKRRVFTLNEFEICVLEGHII